MEKRKEFKSTEYSDKSIYTQDNTLRIYLVRHGQTLANIKGLMVGGGGNAPLTEQGRCDARAVGMGLKREGIVFDAAYSSTLGRAYETADLILSNPEIQVTQMEGLKDIGWGKAEGHTSDWIAKNYPDEGYETYFSGKSALEAESMEAFMGRFGNALAEIARKHENGGNILVVAHSSAALYLSALFDNAGYSLDNTSVSVIEYKNGEKALLTFGDTHYLEDGRRIYEAQDAVTLTIVTNPMTLFRDADIIEGSSDSDYSGQGKAILTKLVKNLGEKSFDAVYESPLGRAGRLAEALDLEAVQESDFSEIFLGDLESLSFEVLENENPDLAASLKDVRDIRKIVTEDGESGEIAAYRMKHGLGQAGAAVEPGGNVLICSHPYILSAFMEKYLPDAGYHGTIDSAQVVVLSYKDGNFSFISAENVGAEDDI